MIDRPTKVLIVDDSAVVRKLLGDALRAEPDVQVVGGHGTVGGDQRVG